VTGRTARSPSASKTKHPLIHHQSALQTSSDHELLEWMPDGVVVVDAAGQIVFTNRRAHRMTGYSRGELGGHDIELLVPERLRAVHRRHRGEYYATHAEPRSMGGVERDFRVRRKDGSEFSADISLGQVQTPNGPQTVAVIRDITERRRLEAALEHQALHDPLTDLANRTLFFDRLRQALMSARREGKKVALVMLDLDAFKHVNDAFGHAVGDELLKALAVRLREGLRATDTVARIGGDEFAWVLPRVAGRQAAERMVRKRLNAIQVAYANDRERLQVRVSAGIAIYPDDASNVDTLIRFADAAMYSAKPKAGGQVTGGGNVAC
jgi:diguanylate cyclase (GGDEF)-like protein/PAS domain S-box-containing protein